MIQAIASVETFSGCFNLIGHTAPDWFLLENVPRIDAQADLEPLGFVCVFFVFAFLFFSTKSNSMFLLRALQAEGQQLDYLQGYVD